MKRSKIIYFVKLFAVFLVLYWLVFHVVFKKKPSSLSVSPPMVSVERPQLMPISEYIVQTGNTVAFNTVDLVARVEGYLQKVNFTDGTFVDENQLLFVIEPKPYLEKLKEAQASVESAKAGLEYATSEYQRQQRMLRENATSQNSVEIWRSRKDQAQADVLKAQANAVNAKISYDYTHVMSPFKGRIGRHLVDPGNLVGNGQATKLATIEQLSPIYVYFNLNEIDVLRLQKAAIKAGINEENISKIPVSVSLQDDEGFPFKGKLNFVNTGLNASTGTLELRAILENKDLKLVPGLFVRARISVSKEKNYLTVPNQSVLFNQIGTYVLTVNEKNIVELKQVTTGPRDQDHIAIVSGINKDDRVVVSGTDFATPGQPVSLRKASSK